MVRTAPELTSAGAEELIFIDPPEVISALVSALTFRFEVDNSAS